MKIIREPQDGKPDIKIRFSYSREISNFEVARFSNEVYMGDHGKCRVQWEFSEKGLTQSQMLKQE